MQENKFVYTLWLAITAVVLLTGGLLITMFALPFERVKPFVDGLARDGAVESFTPSVFERLRFLPLIGLGMVSFGGALIIFKGVAQRLLADLWRASGARYRGLVADARVFFSSARAQARARISLLIVSGLTLLAVLNRLFFLTQPMGHDESYTFIAFAARPFRYVITDYHLPNNHVFHTILVYIAYHLLGNQSWMIRLPAFLAGVLLVPASFLTAKAFFDEPTALVSAGLVAVTPILLSYSTHARGYPLVSLLTLLVLTLGVYVKQKNNRFAWLMWVVLSTLGLYTIPIMIYPWGSVVTWLFLSWATNDIGSTGRTTYLRNLIIAALGTLILAGLLYTPIFIYTGLDRVTGNSFVRSLDWRPFFEDLWARLKITWGEWQTGVPQIISWALTFGFAITIVFRKRITTHRVSFPLAALLWTGPALFVQRVAPPPRVWVVFLPLFIIFASAGLTWLIQKVSVLWESPRSRADVGVFGVQKKAACWSVLIFLVFVSGIGVVQTKSAYDFSRSHQVGPIEQVVLFLHDHLQPERDVVLVAYVDAPALQYYFNQHRISTDYLLSNDRKNPFEHALVIVNKKYGQSIESVVDSQRNFSKELHLETAQQIYQKKFITIYEIQP